MCSEWVRCWIWGRGQGRVTGGGGERDGGRCWIEKGEMRVWGGGRKALCGRIKQKRQNDEHGSVRMPMH